MESKLFTPVTFGPLTLRNRTIRSAAFESMCPGNAPSDMLLDYHRSVAAGGIGMTTVAYAAVTQSGLSFDRQLWMRPEIIPGLRKLTDAIHAEGAAAGIQLGQLRKHVPIRVFAGVSRSVLAAVSTCIHRTFCAWFACR